MPCRVADRFHQRRLGSSYDVRRKILWKSVLYAILWKIWLERNNRVFRNKSSSMEEVVQSIVLSVSEWVSSRMEFLGVALEDLNRSWVVFFKGGRCAKSFQQILWERPPLGVLKLNFDGSFVQSISRGGIRGLIRDWIGNIVRNFSGPADSLDANKAEVLALLIGFHELRSLKGFNAIIEGDSLSAIQWSSKKSSFPWRLAELVEEIQDISSQVGVVSHHFLHEPNVVADGLTKEGVFRSSITFDV